MRDGRQQEVRSKLLFSGDVLRSRYRIVRSLGSGGFSCTYLAEDFNRFNEYCVLKQFAPQLKKTLILEKAQELFEREAGILYRLQHPQIPQFRELFRYQKENEGHLFLVQDYVEGATYHALLNQRIEENTKFSEAEVKRLLTQVLPILEYIHSMGVIHRDISPDNLILRSQDEVPVLIDFGCIKEVENKTQFQLKEITANAAIPLISTALGKAGYAPLEQVERGIVYAHSDLYALAATCVVLLTGKEPQQLIDPNGYRWHWQSLVTLSPKLEWILTTMLSPHPSDRFGSAAKVSKTLQDISIVIPDLPTRKSADRDLHQKIKATMPVLSKISAKFWLFVPLTAILLLAGYFLKGTNLNITNPNSIQADDRLSDRFSYGEKLLVRQTTTPEKEMAINAIARGNYERAVSLFSGSLQTVKNDPEALIYLNNARIGKAKAYSIAVAVPVGSNVNAAQEILRGVAQAQEQINRLGGINKLPLKVQIINDDNDPAIAKRIAYSLSQNKEILGVVGHYASDVTLATAPIYEAKKLVTISPISTSVKLSNFSPYIFRTVPSDYLAARSLAEYMRSNLQQKKVAVFYNSQSSYSQSLQSEFTAAVYLNGGEVTNMFDLADANFNAGDSLRQTVANKAEVIMLAADTNTIDKALQVVQVNANHTKQLSVIGGDGIYTPKTLEVLGKGGIDMVLATPWHSKNNPDNEFTKDARQLWGGEVNWRSAMAYDAARALIAAIAGSPNPTRSLIQRNLSDADFSTAGATSKIKFFPSGDRFSRIQLVKIQPGNNEFGYEFAPINP